MNETAKEWLGKANGDYQTAKRELDARDSPNYDAVCFHAQQCIEKMMKGILIINKVVPPRTHNLIQLFELLQTLCPKMKCVPEDLRYLTNASITFRYPGESADHQDAINAMENCERIRNIMMEYVKEE